MKGNYLEPVRIVMPIITMVTGGSISAITALFNDYSSQVVDNDLTEISRWKTTKWLVGLLDLCWCWNDYKSGVTEISEFIVLLG